MCCRLLLRMSTRGRHVCKPFCERIESNRDVVGEECEVEWGGREHETARRTSVVSRIFPLSQLFSPTFPESLYVIVMLVRVRVSSSSTCAAMNEWVGRARLSVLANDDDTVHTPPSSCRHGRLCSSLSFQQKTSFLRNVLSLQKEN